MESPSVTHHRILGSAACFRGHYLGPPPACARENAPHLPSDKCCTAASACLVPYFVTRISTRRFLPDLQGLCSVQPACCLRNRSSSQHRGHLLLGPLPH